MNTSLYIVYDTDNLPIMVGSRIEVADWLGIKPGSFDSAVSRIKTGKRESVRGNYKVYKI